MRITLYNQQPRPNKNYGSRKNHGSRIFVRSVLFLGLIAVSAVLQAAPPSPGSVISPIDKPVLQPERAEIPDISRESKTLPVPQSSVKVKVNHFTFVGNTTYSDEVLTSVISQYEGRTLTITEIYHVADLVEIYYRYHGYLLTSVYVPAQQINSGSIKLEVLEGRVGEIKIDGELSSYTAEFLIKQVDGLQPGEIIDDKTLEKETLLLGDLPGLQSRAVIRPGNDYGTSDIIFVNEEDRYSGVIGINNYGRKSIGEARVEAGFFMTNPIFEGDLLNLSAIVAQDNRMLFGRIDYDALINTSATRVGFSLSAFKYEVDSDEAGLSANGTLEGSGTSMVLRVSHPLQRSTRNNTSIIVDVRRSTTKEEGSLALPSRHQNTINLLDVFISYDHLYSNYAKTTVFAGLATNFKSIKDSLDRKSQKAKLSLDVSHYQPFFERWFAIARAQGVYSPDPLIDVERFRIGGQGSVRAYPSAELAGDKGGVLSLDVGMNYIVSSAAFGNVVLTPKLFADAGKVFRYDDFGLFGLPASESLAGYGAGLSVLFAKNHTIDFEIVTPTSGKTSSDDRDTRFWLSYRGAL